MHSQHPIHRALVTFSNSATGEVRVKIPTILGIDSEVALSYIGRKAPWVVPAVGDQIVVTSDDANLTNVFWLQTDSPTSTSSPISGVTSNVAGTGISVSGSTGAVTIANTGVTSFTSSSGLSTNTSATGAVSVTNTGVTSIAVGSAGLSRSGATGAVTLTNTGVTSLTGGTGVSLNTSTGAVTASIGQSVATTATPTFGNITASGSGDTSIKINSTSGYAIQYFSINGTNRWHYEVTPSYQSWALVESGVAQRMTVNASTGNTSVTGAVTASGAPSVLAFRGSDLSYNNGAQNVPIVYNTTSYNVGSCYNTSNGLFTAPHTGDYAVSIGVYSAGGSDVSQLWTVVNGGRGTSFALSPPSGTSNLAGAGIIRLTAGDTFGMAAWFGGATATITANNLHTFLRIRYIG